MKQTFYDEPVELTESELDEVAGGNFGNLALTTVAQAVTNTGFSIGQVNGVNFWRNEHRHHIGQVNGVNFGGTNAGTIFG